jgi:hypothetical protein
MAGALPVNAMTFYARITSTSVRVVRQPAIEDFDGLDRDAALLQTVRLRVAVPGRRVDRQL